MGARGPQRAPQAIHRAPCGEQVLAWLPVPGRPGGDPSRSGGVGRPHARQITKSPENTGRAGSLYRAGTSREAQARGALGHRQTCPEQADGSGAPTPERRVGAAPSHGHRGRVLIRFSLYGRNSGDTVERAGEAGRGPSAVPEEGGACQGDLPAPRQSSHAPSPRLGASVPHSPPRGLPSPHVFRSRGQATPVNICLSPCGLREHPACCRPRGGATETPPPPLTQPRPFPGLFSTIMRDLANITHDGPKWIVLDGDIDPMWIESLNTVMDDNKVGGAPAFQSSPPEPQQGGVTGNAPRRHCPTRQTEAATDWDSGRAGRGRVEVRTGSCEAGRVPVTRRAAPRVPASDIRGRQRGRGAATGSVAWKGQLLPWGEETVSGSSRGSLRK